MTSEDAVARALADEPDPVQIEAFRRLSPEERLMTADRLYRLAREVKAAGIRAQHPDWPDSEVHKAVSRSILLART